MPSKRRTVGEVLNYATKSRNGKMLPFFIPDVRTHTDDAPTDSSHQASFSSSQASGDTRQLSEHRYRLNVYRLGIIDCQGLNDGPCL
jgi:hypothetical protein